MRISGQLLVIVSAVLLGLSTSGYSEEKLTVAECLDLLRDPVALKRMDGAIALGEMGAKAEEAVEHLTLLLGDENESVRVVVARALGEIGQNAEVVVPRLVTLLEDDALDVRRDAIDALGKFGRHAEPAVPEILRAVRTSGGGGAAPVGRPPSNEKELEAISHTEIRFIGVRALGRIGVDSKAVRAHLLKSVEDPYDLVRANAFGTFAKFARSNPKNHDAYLPVLIESLGEEDLTVQHAIKDFALALGKSAAEDLLKRLEDEGEEAMVRQRALVCLSGIAAEIKGVIGNEVIASLISLVEKGKWGSEDAAVVLGAIGVDARKDATPALLAAAESTRKGLRVEAFHALFKIECHPDKFLPVLDKGLEDPNADVRLFAADVYGEIEGYGKRTVAALVPILSDVDKVVRFNVLDTLAWCKAGQPKLTEALAKFIENEDYRISHAKAVDAVGNLQPRGQREADILLSVLSGDYNSFVKEDAVKALALVRPAHDGVVAGLIDAVSDRRIQGNAIEALGMLGSEAEAAVAVLKKAEKHLSTHDEAEAALNAIMGQTSSIKRLASSGDAKALNSLAIIHEMGEGATGDFSTARTLYQRAAKLGCADAYYNLGQIHEHGPDKGSVQLRLDGDRIFLVKVPHEKLQRDLGAALSSYERASKVVEPVRLMSGTFPGTHHRADRAAARLRGLVSE